MFRSQNQKAQIYVWAGLCLLLKSFGIRDALATPMPFGVSGPKDTRSLPDSCQALAHSSSEMSKLVTRAASLPSGTSYDAVGQAFAEENELACAIAAYEVALDFDPGVWRTRYGLAVALLQAGNSERAIRELHAVLERAPDSCLAHNALGMALENLTNL